MSAPQCVAKGIDEVAMRIREVAKEHDIPLHENKPLARSLYDTVEIDAFIPENLYKAVAEVISFVFKQRKGASFDICIDKCHTKNKSLSMDALDWDDGNWPKCGKHGVSKAEIEYVLAHEPFVLPDRTPCTDETRYNAVGCNVEGRHILWCSRSGIRKA